MREKTNFLQKMFLYDNYALGKYYDYISYVNFNHDRKIVAYYIEPYYLFGEFNRIEFFRCAEN